MGLEEATVYRYGQALIALGLSRYLAYERPGYWSLLTSAELAHLCREVNATRYTDVRAIQAGLQQTYQVHYSVAGLPQLLHRLGFPYKRTTPRPWLAAHPGILPEQGTYLVRSTYVMSQVVEILVFIAVLTPQY